MDIQQIWCEKYRPKTLDDIIIKPDIKRTIEKFRANNSIPHLLFCGPPGTGKTSLARVIVDDVLKVQSLYINASDESGIDTIRNKVTRFAETQSLDGRIKVIILDESDGLQPGSQRALRNTMEQYADTCRFILTANYKHRIIEPIQSRCQSFELSSDLNDVLKRCISILKSEGIRLGDSEDKQRLAKLIKSTFPDIRKIINFLEQNSTNGILHFEDNIEQNLEFFNKILSFLQSGEVMKLREFIIKNEMQFQNDYPNLLKNLLNHIYQSNGSEQIKQQSTVIVCEHIYQSAFCMDQEINFTACMVKLSDIIKH